MSWVVQEGHADDIDLAGRKVVLALRYRDDVTPATPWEVVLYVDDGSDQEQLDVLAAIFLGQAGGSVAGLYGSLIGDVLAVRRARITLEHEAPRKRIDVVGHLRIEAEGLASAPGEVQCGIPGYDHPGTELFGDVLEAADEALTWHLHAPGRASFATDFEYRSDGVG